jgi:alcohol dehydrogenase (NADP+)
MAGYSKTKFQLNTGAEIPAIGFGTWQVRYYLSLHSFMTPRMITYRILAAQDKEAQEDAVYEALKVGYRHIDTARM